MCYTVQLYFLECKLNTNYNVHGIHDNDYIFADDVVYEGYLQRQTKCGGIKLWNKQWVVVKRDGCLYYHKSRER